ncbi:MAG: glycoside hydrolase family 97 protein [Bacteroidales bacterium]
MKKPAIIFCLLCAGIASALAQHQLKSPNGKIEVNIDLSEGIRFSVALNKQLFIENARVDLHFNGEALGGGAKFKKATSRTENSNVSPVVALKEQVIENHYNELTLSFTNKFSVEFRAFDNGLAYRFVTAIKGEVEVNETANFEFADNFKMWSSPIDAYVSSYEVNYEQGKIADFAQGKNSYLPLLIEHTQGYKMLLTEADIFDYPHMFLKKAKGNTLEATFPPFPLETELIGDRQSKVTKEAGYIARTVGNRSFPWRLLMMTETDAGLVESNLVYLLARDSEIEETGWIKPGRVSWEWWNASNLYGVDFEAGLNTDTYKYYIDFASKNGLEYILLDEGWSLSTMDITQPNPVLDLFEIIRYGKEKNVRIILWASWRAIESQFFVLEKYKEWGVAGIKVDFMDRSDQWMVNFYEKIAREAARNNLLVDFHGAFKPNGLHRAFPNVVSYEGAQGLEYCKWSKSVTPEHNLTLPFIRMVCGPMDYTPGAMRNFHTEEFQPNFSRPGSQGTRCHQLALFVVFESGIQMLADSPSNYEREQESTEFLATVPNTWDELKVLEARVGEYLVVARRKGSTWFVGALNNQTEREFSIDLSFLSDGEKSAVIMQDGVNTDHFAEDYTRIETTVSNQTKLNLKLAKGGGYAARISSR